MNWTTGPLDPAVYWRRRVVVGVPIVALLLILATCAVGSSDSDSERSNTANKQVAAGQHSDPPPKSSSVPPSSSPTPSPSPSPSTSPAPAGPMPCDDNDISVTVSMVHQKYPTNSRIPVQLSLVNTSGKPCTRDVGAGQQETLISAGEQRIWSSDTCSNDHASNQHTLQPNEKLTYWVTWNTTVSTPNCSKPDAAKAGTYQAVGRIGSKSSAPVTVTLT